MCWPTILVTLINNLGTIGTWCSSPSHIIHPIHSSAALPLLSFGALRSLGSSPTNRSLVSFRTRRAWEWLVFARLTCFSWKQKDLLKKPCYFFLSRSTIKNLVFKIPVAQSVYAVVLLLRRFSKLWLGNKFILNSSPSSPFIWYVISWGALRILRQHSPSIHKIS